MLALSWALAPAVLAQTPDSAAGALRREAEELRRAQRLPEALARYREVVRLEPTGFEDRFWVAKLEGWTGRHAAAESAFVRLLAERPDDYDTGIALADVRRWRGDTAGARTALETLLRAHPSDPEVLNRLHALRSPGRAARWEADVEYFGERLPDGTAADGGTLALGTTPGGRVRWRGAATLQEKFDRTEWRGGGEAGVRLSPRIALVGSAFLAPGAEVLPRQSYALGVQHKLGRVVVLTDYGFADYRDADVHRIGPAVEVYAGRWLVAGRYRYLRTRFDGIGGTVDDHAGSLTVGYEYGAAGLVRVFAALGGESFTQPSRELIGRFDARTLGLAWRHWLAPGVGLEALYAHQDRSSGGGQDAYSLRVLRRW